MSLLTASKTASPLAGAAARVPAAHGAAHAAAHAWGQTLLPLSSPPGIRAGHRPAVAAASAGVALYANRLPSRQELVRDRRAGLEVALVYTDGELPLELPADCVAHGFFYAGLAIESALHLAETDLAERGLRVEIRSPAALAAAAD